MFDLVRRVRRFLSPPTPSMMRWPDDPTRYCVDAHGDGVYLVLTPDGHGMLLHTYREATVPPLLKVYPSQTDAEARFEEYAKLCRAGTNPHWTCWYADCVAGDHPGTAVHRLRSGMEITALRPKHLGTRRQGDQGMQREFWLRIETSQGWRSGGPEEVWTVSQPDMIVVWARDALDASLEFDDCTLDHDTFKAYRVSVYGSPVPENPLHTFHSDAN